jgi:hypothetical protein
MKVTITDTTKRFRKRCIKLQEFTQMMANRIMVGVFRHEADNPDNFGTPIQDYHKHLKQKLRMYEQTGNLEFLIDIANYAALEFYNSNHPNQHFKEVDSNGRSVRE